MNVNKIDYSWRYRAIGVVMTTLALLIMIQIVRIQISPETPKLSDEGEAATQELRFIRPARGLIYDRWGHILAANKTVYEVGAELINVENPETIALELTSILHVDYETIFKLASTPPNTETYTVRLHFPVTEEQKQQIEDRAEYFESVITDKDNDIKRPSLRGLVFTPLWLRTYPEKTLASNILGYVNYDGQGVFGVEERYDYLLNVNQQTIRVSLDPTQVEALPQIHKGASLELTIDREMQAAMELLLDQALADTGSEGGVIAVMDPKTGEILALATTPRMDPNEFWNLRKVFPPNTAFNKAISQPYEPGSVFKVLTMAAGLDSGVVKPGTEFTDTGIFEIGGIYIYNWNRAAWGRQDMIGCMEHSLNVCLAWIASKLGKEKFYTYMQAFGFGHTTGVDIAGEKAGRLKIPGDFDWFDSELGTNAFGQGITVTPLQMLAALSAVTNNGKMVSPHIVRAIIDQGYQYVIPYQVTSIPITGKTARTLTEMLAKSLENEASVALVEGYRVAGKTGTGEIAVPGIGYGGDLTNASFAGWGPVDDPRFLVYVWLEKPKTSIWGSVVAAPLFREVVNRVVVYLKLPPDEIRQKLAGQ